MAHDERSERVMRCRIEHEKKNFISITNHELLCLSYKLVALYWQEKSTLLLDENERIDTRIKKCVGALKMTDVLSHYKNKPWA